VVVSRDPRLADVRKSILEHAGFAVIAATDDSSIEEACRMAGVRLIMLGYSLSLPISGESGQRRRHIAISPFWNCTTAPTPNSSSRTSLPMRQNSRTILSILFEIS
jgi:hypothetical protein